jgi:hypothetical protein
MALQSYIGTIAATPVQSYLSSYPAAGMVSVTGTVSFMAWFNTADFAVISVISSMVGMYNGTNNASTLPTTAIQLGAGQSGVANSFDVWTWGGTILVNTGTIMAMPVNTWFHAAYTCTAAVAGSQTHSIYINGALINTSTNTLQVAGTITQVFINGFPETTANLATYAETNTAQIDDVRVYGRLLSASEIKTIYSLRGYRDGIVDGLFARYNFDEAIAGSLVTKCTDFSPNNNPLNIYNVNASTFNQTYLTSIANIDTRPPF